MKSKKTHGGSRPGSGRPKKKKSEKKRSKVIRVPLDKLKAVKDLLKSAVASKGREKHVRGGCIDRTRKKDQVCCYPVGTCDDCQIP